MQATATAAHDTRTQPRRQAHSAPGEEGRRAKGMSGGGGTRAGRGRRAMKLSKHTGGSAGAHGVRWAVAACRHHGSRVGRRKGARQRDGGRPCWRLGAGRGGGGARHACTQSCHQQAQARGQAAAGKQSGRRGQGGKGLSWRSGDVNRRGARHGPGSHGGGGEPGGVRTGGSAAGRGQGHACTRMQQGLACKPHTACSKQRPSVQRLTAARRRVRRRGGRAGG